MQPIISDLVDRYEKGRLSRRELIQGLAFLAAAVPAAAQTSPGAGANPASTTPAASGPGLVANGVDHICVRVKDMDRSAAFYQSLFGLQPMGEDKPHRILRLGRGHVMVSLRQDEPYGTIDHFALNIEGFDREAVTKLLGERGLPTHDDWEYGFYTKDPDGVPVQLMPGAKK